MTPKERAEAQAATETLQLLADQVGVRCGDCGVLIKGRDAIGGFAFMGPATFNAQGELVAKEKLMRPYCQPCVERMHENDPEPEGGR